MQKSKVKQLQELLKQFGEELVHDDKQLEVIREAYKIIDGVDYEFEQLHEEQISQDYE